MNALIKSAVACLICIAAVGIVNAQQPPHNHQHGEAPTRQTQRAKPVNEPHQGHTHPSSTSTVQVGAAGSGEKASQTGKMTIPDLELLNQDGKRIRFYSDLVKDKVVVINFIFTTCTTICPPLGATFARVQKEMGERVGRDVHFISISVDPATDTPERLKAWGQKFNAGSGWTFVTGDKPGMNQLLKALASSSARPEDHSPTIIIGNEAKGQWTRTYGLAKPSQLVKIINDMSEENSTETSNKDQGRQ